MEPASELVSAVENLLTNRLAHRLKQLPDRDICKQIAEQLRGAPLSYLDARMTIRWKAIWSYEFVLLLAEDVAGVWEWQNGDNPL